ncbi:MAG: hypothetical protein M1821_002840 [Bathelium mastoideum]|nr:MAG: hypothetical protein M1821_002840 [Bathelium mastoideum]
MDWYTSKDAIQSQRVLDESRNRLNLLRGGRGRSKLDRRPAQLPDHGSNVDATFTHVDAFSSSQDQALPSLWSGQNPLPWSDMISLPVLSVLSIFGLSKLRLATSSNRRRLGWNQTKTIFVFGDSYSDTAFNWTGKQPSPSNPLGNPSYPGLTSSNGPNWVDFITTTWNESYIETYNLASGGATVDTDLVVPFLPTVHSMKEQVEEIYLPRYGSSRKWSSDTAWFAIWIGINDVGNSFAAGNDTLNSKIFGVYGDLVRKLYVSGARNFLFLNVPPLERTPRTVAEGSEAQALEKADIADFNSRILKLTRDLSKSYLDVSAVHFDAHALFNQVLDDPTAFPETRGYKNVTDWCQQYSSGTPERDTLYPECGVAVNEYLWLNDLHPTYPIHDALAQQIALLLSSP